jgi:hypothetical protein
LSAVKVAVALRRKDGKIIPFRVYDLSRVPSVGEIVANCCPNDDERPYRVAKVVHLLSVGDDERIAEIYCEETHGRPDGFDTN